MQYTHLRSAWEDPALPVDGPSFNWPDIDTISIHYPGDDNLPDGDPGESADDLPGYIRGVQRFYETHPDRGYSIGYSVAVDWLGGTWELRGDTFKCAANVDWNHRTFAIWMLVDGQDGATAEARAAVRGLVAQVRAVRPGAQIRGHFEIATSGTPCPGGGIRAQLADGLFEPGAEPAEPPPPPPPPPEPPEENDDMKHIYVGSYEAADGWQWWAGDGSVRSLVNEADVKKGIQQTKAGAKIQYCCAVTLRPLDDPDEVKKLTWHGVRWLGKLDTDGVLGPKGT